jgi:hypothetical protein
MILTHSFYSAQEFTLKKMFKYSKYLLWRYFFDFDG